jgi:hypothetical protein
MAVRTTSLRRELAFSPTFATLLGVSLVTPLAGLPQLFTGTVVNAALFVAVVLLGPRAAVAIGTVPSAVAVVAGVLPPLLAPLVMLGNALLVVVFHVLRSRGWWLGAVPAVVLKGCWLFTGTALLTATGLIPASVVPVAMALMGWPQLATASSGAVISYALLRLGRRL